MATTDNKFPITFHEMSVWEIAHRYCNEDPYPFLPRPLHKDVKDALRVILYEIHYNRLDSNLIYTKREHDKNPSPEEFYLRTHLDAIGDCVSGDSFPRKLLKFIFIDRYSFKHWCTKTNTELPAFWFAADLSWEDEHYLEEDEFHEKLQKNSHNPRQGKMDIARGIASEIWNKNPMVPVMTIARSERMQNAIKHVEADTIRKWIEPLRPKENIPKRGRPKALDSETEQLLMIVK